MISVHFGQEPAPALGNKSAGGEYCGAAFDNWCGSSLRSAVCFREPGNGGQISAFGIVNIETVLQAFYKTSENSFLCH